MPDSIGAGGFPNNVNIGHEHLDMSSGLTYQYQGGRPGNILNWKIINGVTATDPNTTGWGTKQLGAMWFNSSEKVYKYWDGTLVQSLMTSPPLYNYKLGFSLQEEFISGTTGNGLVGALGWGFSGGVLTVQPSTLSNPGIIRRDTGAVINTVTTLQLQLQNNSTFSAELPHTIAFIQRLLQVDTDEIVRIGAFSAVAIDPPASGIYFEKLAADLTWFAAIQIASVTTRVNTGIPINTDFHTFTYVYDGSKITFKIDGATVGEIVQTVPNVLIDPAVQMVNTVAASKLYEVDYFEIKLSGLTRA